MPWGDLTLVVDVFSGELARTTAHRFATTLQGWPAAAGDDDQRPP